MKVLFNLLRKRQSGITGLETAIILIAFVVVASVFAYTVLSAGIFSSEKNKEAIYEGLETVSASMEIIGSVIARDTDTDQDIDQLIFTVSNAVAGGGIDLTVSTDTDNDGLLSDESTKLHTTIMTFFNKNERIDDLAWTKVEVGRGDGDNMLEPGEKFTITAYTSALSNALNAYDEFTIEVKPSQGSALIFERTIPPVVDPIVDLK